MRNQPWPEMDSKQSPGRTVRTLLDYIAWITVEMRQLGYHAGADRDEWCRRVQQAYVGFFIPMVLGYGDPDPPDVPYPRNPGIWPDIPSCSIPGMTLRHQLKVLEKRSIELRARHWIQARESEIQDWDRRLSIVYGALHHGDALPMPDEARTEPSEKAIEQAADAARILKDRARRRARQIKEQLQLRRTAAKKKKAAPKKPAVPKETATAVKKAAPKKKAAAVKKAAPKKKAVAKKKAAPKKKAVTKKKAAPKKKAVAKKKAATKKKAAPKKKA